MKNWKEIGKKILFPSIWLIVLFVIISTVSLVYIFMNGLDTNPLAYGFYVFAFYTLLVCCSLFIKEFPKYKKGLKNGLYQNKYSNKYLTDIDFKTKVNLNGSLFITFIFAIINAISGVIYQTHWFGIFAIYYGIIGLLRFLLLGYMIKNPIGTDYVGELKRTRICSFLLLIINLTLSGIILMMVYFNRGFNYQGFLIYVIAMYAFYMLTISIIDMIKYRKYKSPIVSMSKIIKMTSALFSMLFLETAMFAQFGGDMPIEAQQLMIMLTGAGICIIILIMCFYMIIETTKGIRKYKK